RRSGATGRSRHRRSPSHRARPPPGWRPRQWPHRRRCRPDPESDDRPRWPWGGRWRRPAAPAPPPVPPGPVTAPAAAGRPAPSFVAYQQFVLGHRLLSALDPAGVQRNAVHGADLLTLGLVEMADALGAQVRVDDVDFLALGDGPVRAFRFADVAVDAVVGNHQGHGLLRNKAGQPW